MKALIINSVCGYGSTGKIVSDLYDMLLEKGDLPAIAFGRNKGIDDINSYKIGGIFSTLFHVLMTRVFDMHGLWSKNTTKGLLKYMDEFKPDVVHLHNLHGYYLNLKILFEYLSANKIKIVWTLHDCWSMTGHCAHFEYVDCNKWQEKCYECPQKSEYPKSRLIDRSKKNFEFKKALFTMPEDMIIITPSQWLKKIVKKSYLSKYKVRTINTGIDLDIFKPAESDIKNKLGLKDKKIILGVASTFSKRKGFDDFLKLSKKLNSNYQIVLAGLNKKQISKLPSEIIGISRQNSLIEMAKLYSTADIFLNPTKEDTFPTTILESLACGTPVITYDVGGCSEAVDNKTGILVKKDDVDGLIDAINMINKKPINSEDCIKRARKFDKKKQIVKTYDVYNLV